MTQEFDFRAAFIDDILSNQRKWSHDRSQTVGASEVFGCMRRSWFLKHQPQKADASAQSLGAAQRGNIIENSFVVPTLNRIFGEKNVKLASEDQESFVSGHNSATPDALIFPDRRDILSKYGIADIEADCFATEIKSFDPRIFLQEEKTIHRGQGITQLGLIRELTPYKPVYVVILYVNAADFFDIRPFVVKFDPAIFAAAQNRAEAIMTAKSAYDMRAEGKVNDQCRYCPFQEACRAAETDAHPGNDVIVETDEFSVNEVELLEAAAGDYRSALKSEKAAGELKATSAEELRRLLNLLGTRKAVTDRYSINHAVMDGKETLDKAAMIADGINLELYKKVGHSFTRLTVTER